MSNYGSPTKHAEAAEQALRAGFNLYDVLGPATQTDRELPGAAYEFISLDDAVWRIGFPAYLALYHQLNPAGAERLPTVKLADYVEVARDPRIIRKTRVVMAATLRGRTLSLADLARAGEDPVEDQRKREVGLRERVLWAMDQLEAWDVIEVPRASKAKTGLSFRSVLRYQISAGAALCSFDRLHYRPWLIFQLAQLSTLLTETKSGEVDQFWPLSVEDPFGKFPQGNESGHPSNVPRFRRSPRPRAPIGPESGPYAPPTEGGPAKSAPAGPIPPLFAPGLNAGNSAVESAQPARVAPKVADLSGTGGVWVNVTAGSISPTISPPAVAAEAAAMQGAFVQALNLGASLQPTQAITGSAGHAASTSVMLPASMFVLQGVPHGVTPTVSFVAITAATGTALPAATTARPEVNRNDRFRDPPAPEVDSGSAQGREHSPPGTHDTSRSSPSGLAAPPTVSLSAHYIVVLVPVAETVHGPGTTRPLGPNSTEQVFVEPDTWVTSTSPLPQLTSVDRFLHMTVNSVDRHPNLSVTNALEQMHGRMNYPRHTNPGEQIDEQPTHPSGSVTFPELTKGTRTVGDQGRPILAYLEGEHADISNGRSELDLTASLHHLIVASDLNSIDSLRRIVLIKDLPTDGHPAGIGSMDADAGPLALFSFVDAQRGATATLRQIVAVDRADEFSGPPAQLVAASAQTAVYTIADQLIKRDAAASADSDAGHGGPNAADVEQAAAGFAAGTTVPWVEEPGFLL